MKIKLWISISILFAALFVLTACAPKITNSPTESQTPAPTLPAGNSPTPVDESASTSVPQSDTAKPDLARLDTQGAIEISISPVNLQQPGETLDFDVSMDTHSVDLSMDLAQFATLTTDTGVSVKALKWEAPKGGHHVSGKLSFPSKSDGGFLLDGAKIVTITLTDVNVPSRVFTWNLPLP